MKLLAIKTTESGPAVYPSVSSALSDYPLSRPLIMFVDRNAKQSVREFVEFCTSEEGQKIVTASGYARLK